MNGRIHAVIVLLLVCLASLMSTQLTMALWSDTETVVPKKTTAAIVTAQPLQCSGVPSLSKTIRWAPFTDHPLEDATSYRAYVGPIEVGVSKAASGQHPYSLTVDLDLFTLLGSAKVTVAVWPDTVWAQSSSITLGRTALFPPLGFACP